MNLSESRGAGVPVEKAAVAGNDVLAISSAVDSGAGHRGYPAEEGARVALDRRLTSMRKSIPKIVSRTELLDLRLALRLLAAEVVGRHAPPPSRPRLAGSIGPVEPFLRAKEEPMAQSSKTARSGRLVAADAIEGTAVLDPKGSKIGTIERLMIDKRSGDVAYAVMSFGGFLGLGERHFPLPWPGLAYKPEDDAYVVDVTAEQLKDAPGWRAGEKDELADEAYCRQVSVSWGYGGTL
jgi:hypothetical protein